VTENLKIGIAGLGTVGAGVLKILGVSGDLIAQCCARAIDVVGICARDRARERGLGLAGAAWFDDAIALAKDPTIEVFIELIGGSDGVALDAVRTALAHGKHVVTANKALIALHGAELGALAEAQGVALNFEAAVAGGIPIIKALREGLSANRVSRVYGILNGTCNYILSDMEETGRSFDAVLKQAQELGYAESDPSFDIGGIDTAHKLAILASIAFGAQVDFSHVHIEGIEYISANDIIVARELGYAIKLLGLACRTDQGVEQRVHPCLVKSDDAIAAVNGVVNAVVVESDQLGRLVMEGAGAGESPTASAVIADIIDIARGLVLPPFLRPSEFLRSEAVAPMARHEGAYYIRLTAIDRPGVMAVIAEDLAHEGVSIDTIIQRGAERADSVPIILLTHQCRESVMVKALARISSHDVIVKPPRMIRIEQL